MGWKENIEIDILGRDKSRIAIESALQNLNTLKRKFKEYQITSALGSNSISRNMSNIFPSRTLETQARNTKELFDGIFGKVIMPPPPRHLLKETSNELLGMYQKQHDELTESMNRNISTAKKLDSETKKYNSTMSATAKEANSYYEGQRAAQISQMGFFRTLRLSTAEFNSHVTSQGKFNNRMGRFSARIRMATHGLRGFRMELLGVMFFGMAVSGMIMNMMKPAMDAFGISSLWSSAMLLLFLPIINLLYPAISGLIKWIMDWDDKTKLIVGGVLVAVAALMAFLFVVGTVGLGIGALIVVFAKANADTVILGQTVKAGTSIFSTFASKITTSVIPALVALKAQMIKLLTTEVLLGLPLWVIIGIIGILAYMWYKNIWNMREQTGVIFNGIYSIIRGVILMISALFIDILGIILGVLDVIGRTIENLAKLISWSFKEAWNSAIDDIIGFMDTAISAYNKAAGFFGKEEITLGLDLSKYKADIGTFEDLSSEIANSYDGVIDKQITGVRKRLSYVKNIMAPIDDLMYGIGNASIESGKTYELNKQLESLNTMQSRLEQNIALQKEQEYWAKNPLSDTNESIIPLESTTTSALETPLNVNVTQENNINIDGGFDMDNVRTMLEENNEKNKELLKKEFDESIYNTFNNISR